MSGAPRLWLVHPPIWHTVQERGVWRMTAKACPARPAPPPVGQFRVHARSCAGVPSPGAAPAHDRACCRIVPCQAAQPYSAHQRGPEACRAGKDPRKQRQHAAQRVCKAAAARHCTMRRGICELSRRRCCRAEGHTSRAVVCELGNIKLAPGDARPGGIQCQLEDMVGAQRSAVRPRLCASVQQQAVAHDDHPAP